MLKVRSVSSRVSPKSARGSAVPKPGVNWRYFSTMASSVMFAGSASLPRLYRLLGGLQVEPAPFIARAPSRARTRSLNPEVGAGVAVGQIYVKQIRIRQFCEGFAQFPRAVPGTQ